MFNSQGKLDIFENFLVDPSLPKNTPTTKDAIAQPRVSIITSDRLIIGNSGETNKKSFFSKLHDRLFKREPKPTITIEQFFASVKNSTEQIDIVNQRAKGYETAILKAKLMGQRALYENLTHNLEAVRSESNLIAIGLTKFLSEEKLVEFVKKAKKGLRLDWIENFTRMIPDELHKKKVECDARYVFDNYVILHYDPQSKSWAETEEEKSRKKDPILFGVIQGRRRLYYIGDWIDEFCNLTLDQVADTIGADNIKTLDSDNSLYV
jgi:hypothetical protein